ncbi:hypothetical protein GCM10009528_30290 [Kineococcus aurantiacus]
MIAHDHTDSGGGSGEQRPGNNSDRRSSRHQLTLVGLFVNGPVKTSSGGILTIKSRPWRCTRRGWTRHLERRTRHEVIGKNNPQTRDRNQRSGKYQPDVSPFTAIEACIVCALSLRRAVMKTLVCAVVHELDPAPLLFRAGRNLFTFRLVGVRT